jgi:hypothetical protein
MAQPARPTPQAVRIEIAVDEKGTFTGPPALQHVEIGDQVSWFNNKGSGAFNVVFQADGTPFDPPVYNISDPNRYGIATNPGRFHYSVSAVDKNGKIHSIHGCPELEVDGS